jgi:hypothetical protein
MVFIPIDESIDQFKRRNNKQEPDSEHDPTIGHSNKVTKLARLEFLKKNNFMTLSLGAMLRRPAYNKQQ